MKKTILNFLFVVSLILLVFIGSAYSVQKPLLENFHTYFHSTFEIPGLKEGFIPQGITYVEKEDLFILSGYIHKEKDASCLYILDHGSSSKVELYKDENTPYYGSCKSITNNQDTIFISDSKGVWILPLKDIIEKSKVILNHSFKTDTEVKLCSIHDKYLWIGEENEKNTILMAYLLNNNSISSTPTYAIQTDIGLQGFAFDQNNDMYLSISGGIDNSSLDIYENILKKESDTTISINNTEIPLWILDTKNTKYQIVMPPLSKAITFKDNDLYIIFDSASKKYKFGKPLGFDHIYRY